MNYDKKQHSLGKRYHKMNNKDMVYKNQIAKANQKIEKYAIAYYNAIKYIKKNLQCYILQKNILVYENGKYRILNHSDFYNYDENRSFNKEVRNQLYCDIYNYLCAIEQRNKIIADYNNIKQNNKHLTAPDYTIKDKIPDNAIDFLYELSLGDFEIIKSLAQLCYKILFKPNTPLYPTVILADRAIHNVLFEFFCRLTEMKLVKSELNQLAKITELQLIASANWNNTVLLTVSIESDISETESKIKTIKKIIRGQNLSIKHPYYSGKLFINNQIPFVYITESHEKYLKMKNIYNAQLIKIHSKKITPLLLSTAFDMWFRNDFTKLGFKTYNNPETNFFIPKITNDDIFKSFSNNICVFDETLDCSTTELYTAYTDYYKKFYGEAPLSFRKFRTQFAIFKNLDTCRPHHNNESNPRCFRGVGIDYDKYTELLEKGENTAIKCTKKDFVYHLHELIRKEFPEIDY